MSKLRTWVEQHWYAQQPGCLASLLPLEKLYRYAMVRRQQAYAQGSRPSRHPGVPVIIVGNLHVGGGGKSPLVAALVQYFAQQGYKPGIVSRGYAGKASSYPQLVTQHSRVEEVGDEPLMLAQQTGLPVAVDPNRAAAAELLVRQQQCNLIVSDDGLQHLGLARDIELVVIDAARGWGNGRCLPVGPLREPEERLLSVDWVILQSSSTEVMQPQTAVMPARLVNHLANPVQTYQLEFSGWRRGDGYWQANCPFSAGQKVNALAGISNPLKFFNQLSALNLQVNPRPLADHARLQAQDLLFTNADPVIMTAKDAVKLQPWLTQQHWVAEVSAKLAPEFLQKLQSQLGH